MSNRPDDRDDPEDDVYGEDDMFSQRERYSDRRSSQQQRPRVVSEFVRRAIENTMGSVSSTGNLSREALNYVLERGDRGKREVVRIIAHEVGEFMRGIDLSSEVVKVLSNIQVEVNASIRFKPTKDGSVRPEISGDSNVSVVKDPNAASEPPEPAPDPAEPSKPPEGT